MINDRHDGASTFVETNHLFKDHTSETSEQRNDQPSSKPYYTIRHNAFSKYVSVVMSRVLHASTPI